MHGGIAVELKCKAKIMDAAAIDRTLVRIAHEILEKNDGTEDLCLIGSCRSVSWTSRSTVTI